MADVTLGPAIAATSSAANAALPTAPSAPLGPAIPATSSAADASPLMSAPAVAARQLDRQSQQPRPRLTRRWFLNLSQLPAHPRRPAQTSSRLSFRLARCGLRPRSMRPGRNGSPASLQPIRSAFRQCKHHLPRSGATGLASQRWRRVRYFHPAPVTVGAERVMGLRRERIAVHAGHELRRYAGLSGFGRDALDFRVRFQRGWLVLRLSGQPPSARADLLSVETTPASRGRYALGSGSHAAIRSDRFLVLHRQHVHVPHRDADRPRGGHDRHPLRVAAVLGARHHDRDGQPARPRSRRSSTTCGATCTGAPRCTASRSRARRPTR